MAIRLARAHKETTNRTVKESSSSFLSDSMSSLSLCSVSCSIYLSAVSDRNLGPATTCYTACDLYHFTEALLQAGSEASKARADKSSVRTGSGVALWLASATEQGCCRRHSSQGQSYSKGQLGHLLDLDGRILPVPRTFERNPRPHAELTPTAACPG